jgi:hypothetical protein
MQNDWGRQQEEEQRRAGARSEVSTDERAEGRPEAAAGTRADVRAKMRVSSVLVTDAGHLMVSIEADEQTDGQIDRQINR